MNVHQRRYLPDATVLEEMLRHHSIDDLTQMLGFCRRAITTRLRRAGLGIGLLPKRAPVLNKRLPQYETPAPRLLPPDRVVRITISGARVTMPRVVFIDGRGD